MGTGTGSPGDDQPGVRSGSGRMGSCAFPCVAQEQLFLTAFCSLGVVLPPFRACPSQIRPLCDIYMILLINKTGFIT